MRGKGLPPLAPHPHPRVWPPTSASLRKVYLDEVEQFTENQKASVASLRRCSPSARNGVRLPSGMLFSLAGIPIMNLEEVKQCLEVLNLRERLIVKLAIIAGMRPGEIFGLTWGRISDTYAEIVQRVYRGDIDTPKTYQSVRKAALSCSLAAEIEAWRQFAVDTKSEAWVFPSERMTPLSKDNCWRRHIQPRLATVGLGWANFWVMRRTHSSVMKKLGVDPKLVADQPTPSLVGGLQGSRFSDKRERNRRPYRPRHLTTTIEYVLTGTAKVIPPWLRVPCNSWGSAQSGE